jgi:hypothetical protein
VLFGLTKNVGLQEYVVCVETLDLCADDNTADFDKGLRVDFTASQD